MMTIRRLPTQLVNQIAAGEVVERPASALKELLENAIDAEATSVEITLRAGGKELIDISDDGCGMAQEEMLLALERHATSKLPQDDLTNITTMGFRGEALPSIASIAKMRLESRTAGQDQGWSITIDHGRIVEQGPCAMNPGTRVVISDIFAKIPARQKFLKSDRSELMASQDVVRRLSMSVPKVGFRLQHHNRTLFHAQAQVGDAQQMQKMRLCDTLGQEFIDNAIRLDVQRDAMRLYGLISIATYNRGTSVQQYLFVNGRPVRDRQILSAIRAGYRDVLAHDRFPVLCIYISLPPDQVDINVHPAKSEVRFADPARVRGMIVTAIRNALSEGRSEAGSMAGNSAISKSLLQRFQSHRMSGFQRASGAGSVVSDSAGASVDHSRSAGLFDSQRLPPQGRIFAEAKSNLTGEPGSPPDLGPDCGYEAGLKPPENDDFASVEQTTVVTEEMTDYPLGVARGQIGACYIVAESPDALILVDQHAAHERIVYDRMKEAMKGGVARQALLVPEVVDLDEIQCLALENRAAFLKDLGLVLERFGKQAIIVREVPDQLKNSDTQAMIRDLADELAREQDNLTVEDQISNVFRTMACYGSVRSGRYLSIPEMNALLRQMEKTPNSQQCNHGRPTFIRLQKDEIERLFERG